MYSFRNIKQGLRQVELDLNKLLDQSSLERFDQHWESFLNSDPLNPSVLERNQNIFKCLCDHHIPTKVDNRPPILLLFGNSTPHSIMGELYFAWEGNKREHRMWRLFREFGFLDLDLKGQTELEAQNKLRKSAMFSLEYESPFRVGMDVFVSIPTTPSKPPWSGVAGVRKLLGAKGLRTLIEHEQNRMQKTIDKFLGDAGVIIAFQKDAYEGIVSNSSPRYKLNKAIDGSLKGKCLFNEKIPVYCVAPTRFLLGGQAKESLRKLVLINIPVAYFRVLARSQRNAPAQWNRADRTNNHSRLASM